MLGFQNPLSHKITNKTPQNLDEYLLERRRSGSPEQINTENNRSKDYFNNANNNSSNNNNNYLSQSNYNNGSMANQVEWRYSFNPVKDSDLGRSKETGMRLNLVDIDNILSSDQTPQA